MQCLFVFCTIVKRTLYNVQMQKCTCVKRACAACAACAACTIRETTILLPDLVATEYKYHHMCMWLYNYAIPNPDISMCRHIDPNKVHAYYSKLGLPDNA